MPGDGAKLPAIWPRQEEGPQQLYPWGADYVVTGSDGLEEPRGKDWGHVVGRQDSSGLHVVGLS